MRLFSLVLVVLCFWGCESNIVGVEEESPYYEFSLSTDLEIDENGYYSMYLNSDGQR